MNAIDRLVAWLDPLAGMRRKAAREVLDSYEGAKPSRVRKFRRESKSPNDLVGTSAGALRAQARYLERNHDVARGILRTMVNNVVGPRGIGIEPQPRDSNGEIHDAYATALRDAWREWCLVPEVTQRLSFARVQRMLARTWFRDGEGWAQQLYGAVPFLDHGTAVPFSLELFEPDMIPLDYEDGDRIRQGIERNAWGKFVAVWVYRAHPLDKPILLKASDLKRIPAANILHIAALDRIGQLRGVSEFASILTRLEDIKDYEESERVAAKIAARLTAYVKKGAPELYSTTNLERDENGNPLPRELPMSAGMIFDGLAVGEEIGVVDSKRPNPNLITFRQGQLRAIAAGAGTSYSSIARDYNGTFSAQRQELVEQWGNYAVLTDDFTADFVQPVWSRFVQVADMSGVVKRPRSVLPELADDALYIAQAMPWIDPLKEAMAWELLVRAGFASEVEVIRRRGGNPRDLLDQIAAFRKQAAGRDLVFSSDPANDDGGDSATNAASIDPDDDASVARAAATRRRRAQEPAPAPLSAVLESTPAEPPVVNVTINEAPTNVAPAVVNVTNQVPEQPAAPVDVVVHANLPEQPAPVVHVQPAISVAAPEVRVVLPEQAAPVVNVRNEVQPAEVKVQLPARKTETSVTRDASGNLISATQVETDL